MKNYSGVQNKVLHLKMFRKMFFSQDLREMQNSLQIKLVCGNIEVAQKVLFCGSIENLCSWWESCKTGRPTGRFKTLWALEEFKILDAQLKTSATDEESICNEDRKQT